MFWNEAFSVPLRPNTGSSFVFTVLDEDMTTDDVCGVGNFKLDKCGVFNSNAQQSYTIRLINGKDDGIAGTLRIVTRYV